MSNVAEKAVPETKITLYSNAPYDLVAKALCAVYKLEPNSSGGKPSKVPYDPRTGQRAKINDADTLCGFDEAVHGVRSSRYDGINIAFGYDDLIGIDLDKVLEESAGEFICEKAREVHDRFKKAGAYIEISPSGTGLRIICKGGCQGLVRVPVSSQNLRCMAKEKGVVIF